MSKYGNPPVDLGLQDFDLKEVMYYLYLPVVMPGGPLRMPKNLECCRPLIWKAMGHTALIGRDVIDDYVYISARKGWATPDNPLNRPGWHADGFGTDDLNYVWWSGPGTRFLIGDLGDVPTDHRKSMEHFDLLGNSPRTLYGPPHRTTGTREVISNYPRKHLYGLDPYVVHATPIITTPQWRQYVKISISRHKYNLENNSHNYLFDYDWPMHGREEVRNDTHTAQRDYA